MNSKQFIKALGKNDSGETLAALQCSEEEAKPVLIKICDNFSKRLLEFLKNIPADKRPVRNVEITKKWLFWPDAEKSSFSYEYIFSFTKWAFRATPRYAAWNYCKNYREVHEAEEKEQEKIISSILDNYEKELNSAENTILSGSNAEVPHKIAAHK